MWSLQTRSRISSYPKFSASFSPTQQVLMEEVDESEANWLHELGNELSKDLLDYTLPLVYSPEAETEAVPSAPHQESLTNKLISTVYSGPTISDIENALALSYRSNDLEGRSRTQPM